MERYNTRTASNFPGLVFDCAEEAQSGYKHIDTAYNYHTEKYVGNAVRESGIPREELFITTKLPWHHYARVAESFQESLDALGLGYIDLYLIHWPQPILYDPNDPLPKNPDGTPKTTNYPFTKIWADMERLLDTGKVRAIGVSNFSIKNLEILLESAKVVPAVNQVELHPYLAQPELVDYCKQKGIAITAYTPTGYQTVRDDPVIVELASKYRVSPAQVILAWHMSRGVIVTPKSANAERQRENINVSFLHFPINSFDVLFLASTAATCPGACRSSAYISS
uniref:Reductase AKOR1 n=1 Tax=Pleurotus djamor TaxID=34470 RepID=Q68SU0_PLEDJ|nr:reductase AKOR1 [Pleurotus djamor]